MYDDVYQILEKYNNKKTCVDENFIKDVFEVVKDFYQVEKYVTKPTFKKMKGSFANYDDGNKTIIFDLSKPRQKDLKLDFPDLYYLFYNAYILLDIYHEFVHVDQYKILDENKEDALLCLLINISMPTVDPYDLLYEIKRLIFKRYYRRNWSYDPCERMANLLGGINLINTINKIPQDTLGFEQLIRLMTLETDNHCIDNYKLKGNMTNSPTIDFLKKLPFSYNKKILKTDEVKQLFNDPTLTFEDRILYGLPLTKEEYLKEKKEHELYHEETHKSFESLIKVYYKK